MENFELSIIWWNTSLSPPISSKRDKSTEEKRVIIAQVIKSFMDADYEFICLGEVGPDDLMFFEKHITPQKLGYFCAKGTDQAGRLFFDTCIYFKKHHSLVRADNSDVKNFIMTSASSKFKYGQKYKFNLFSDDIQKLTIYLSHWPSKLHDNSLKIASIAERLRVNIEEELEETKDIILIGDYNVEPYHQAVVHHLQSSRERDLVLKKPNVFYNPCWKFLSSTNKKILKPNYHGTYFYLQGSFNYWHVIDQIMFSHNFLSEKWDLQDKYINIINLHHRPSDVVKVDIISDHNPLSAVIHRKKI